jgi:CSLREA domain-containing protein
MSGWRPVLLRLAVLALLVFNLLAIPQPAEAATYVVNTTDDTTLGTFCDETHCSLREAIQEANRRAGPDRIRFNIPGAAPYVILLEDHLPPIADDQTYIEGDSEPEFEGHPVIVLDGSNLNASCALNITGDGVGIFGLSIINTGGDYTSCGISVSGEEVLIRGNYIGLDSAGNVHGNLTGISLHGSGTMVFDNAIAGNDTGITAWVGPQTIQGNRIGTDPGGTSAALPSGTLGLPSGIGIIIDIHAANVLIGGPDPSQRNVISGLNLGVSVGSILGTEVVGNYIGTDLTGSRPLPNWIGIDLPRGMGEGGAPNRVRSNVISGNTIGILGAWDGDSIADNLIGTDASGTRAIGNTEAGIHIESGSRVRIQSNVISGNEAGILVSGAGEAPFGALILMNQIGTDAAGAGAIPNRVGVHVNGGVLTSIGGDEPGHGNVISGNEIGVVLAGGSAVVRANQIGLSEGGAALPNVVGIQITTRDEPIRIDNVGGGNEVAFNASHGIYSAGGAQVEIRGNRIRENGGHGIYLTLGEAGSFPLGAQNTVSRNSIYGNEGLGIRVEGPEVNFGVRPPVLTGIGPTSASGTACPGCAVELFLADPDPSGSGEGVEFVAMALVRGDGSFEVLTSRMAPCSLLTATATDSLGNTSEFSENYEAGICADLLPPVALTGILLAGIAGGVLAVVIRRRPPGWSSLPWAALGGLIGVGLAVVVLMTPNVQVVFPEDGEQEPGAPPGNQPPPQQVPPTGATSTATASVSVTLTPTATETLEPTFTPTPTLGAPLAEAAQNANCRFGPGTVYDVVGYLLQGQSAPVVGRNAENTWWAITIPERRQPCWVSGGTLQASGDLGLVQILAAPPTPTPSPTSEPEGCWVWNANRQQNLCVAPCPPNAQPGGACAP